MLNYVECEALTVLYCLIIQMYILKMYFEDVLGALEGVRTVDFKSTK